MTTPTLSVPSGAGRQAHHASPHQTEACALWGFRRARLSRTLLGTASWERRVFQTRVSRPQMGWRGRRRSMRAGHKRSQDAAPAQAAPWGEIRRQPPRTEPKPRKNAVSVGVKNISTPDLHSLHQEFTNSARGSDRCGRDTGVRRTRRPHDLRRSDSTEPGSPPRTPFRGVKRPRPSGHGMSPSRGRRERPAAAPRSRSSRTAGRRSGTA